MKTHAYHWNVTGPQFHTLHVMFEEQYREMWAALDEIAERVRALGVFAPSSGKSVCLSELTTIENADETPPAATSMIENLLAGHGNPHPPRPRRPIRGGRSRRRRKRRSSDSTHPDSRKNSMDVAGAYSVTLPTD